jgi:putative ATPase
VLDLNAASGLLTSEAIRCVRKNGVYACFHTQNNALALIEQASALPELMRPVTMNYLYASC